MSGDHHSIAWNSLTWTLALLLGFLMQHILVHYRWFYIPSSAFIVLVSYLTGLLLSSLVAIGDNWSSEGVKSIIAEVFYYLMLPIIIFNAGYHLRPKVFLKNLDGILSLALIGTWLNILLLSIILFYVVKIMPYVGQNLDSLTFFECIAFSSLLSSTDPVSALAVFSSLRINENLFYLVLGESLLNDAVAISIFNSASHFMKHIHIPINSGQSVLAHSFYYFSRWLGQLLAVFVLSYILGYFFSLVMAYVCKSLNFDRDDISPLVCSIFLGYAAFFCAEGIHLSGVIACFSVGLNLMRICNKLFLAKESLLKISYCIECVGYVAETASMATLGLALTLVRVDEKLVTFTAVLLFCCLIVRAVSVFSLLGLDNMIRCLRVRGIHSYRQIESPRKLQMTTNWSDTQRESISYIPLKHGGMVWMSGLRGALNLALAAFFPNLYGNQAMVYTTTLLFVIGSIFIFGGVTVPLIKLLDIEMLKDSAGQQGGHDDEEITLEVQGLIEKWEKKYIIDPFLKTAEQRDRGRATVVHSACCLSSDGISSIDE